MAAKGREQVDKYMFRYPKNLAIEAFEEIVSKDIALTTSYLASVALPTKVTIQSARVFRNPATSVLAVTQTQQRLDLGIHEPLDLSQVNEERAGKNKDRTAQDLDALIESTELLINEHDRYPDVTRSSGNLRRSNIDGSVTLIDVMPFYADGSRAIGDCPIGALESIQDSISLIKQFVGTYGA